MLRLALQSILNQPSGVSGQLNPLKWRLKSAVLWESCLESELNFGGQIAGNRPLRPWSSADFAEVPKEFHNSLCGLRQIERLILSF